MDLGNGEARKVQYQFWFSFKFGLQSTIFKNATPLCKNTKVIATVAAMGLLLSISALKKPYSQNSFAQVSNSGSTKAGISKAGYHMEQADLSYKSEGNRLSVKLEDRLLAYIAAAATIAGEVLHLMMIGPLLKPANFLYTDILFIVAGLAQIFWALPMIEGRADIILAYWEKQP
jgi:hypothetical protein